MEAARSSARLKQISARFPVADPLAGFARGENTGCREGELVNGEGLAGA